MPVFWREEHDLRGFQSSNFKFYFADIVKIPWTLDYKSYFIQRNVEFWQCEDVYSVINGKFTQ